MSELGFYNSNDGITYPFVDGGVGSLDAASDSILSLPNTAIVDAGFILSLAENVSELSEADIAVTLESVVRSSEETLTFRFRPWAFDELLDVAAIIEIPIDTDKYSTAKVEFDTYPTPGQHSDPCDSPAYGEGFVVFGDLSELVALLPDVDDELTGEEISEGRIEHALVQNMNLAFVRTISVGNFNRVRVEAAEGCPEIEYPDPYAGTPRLRYTTCLLGDVRFVPGHNSEIGVSVADNALVFGGRVGAGDGIACDEVLAYPDETPPDGSQLLSGGPSCDEVLRSINGLSGKNIPIVGRTGVTITPDPDNNTIVVDVNLNELLVCEE